jgi:hypothetical protein
MLPPSILRERFEPQAPAASCTQVFGARIANAPLLFGRVFCLIAGSGPGTSVIMAAFTHLNPAGWAVIDS